LIAPPGELVYELQTDHGTRRVESPATIWVPAGCRHAAQLVRGRGVFACVIMGSTAQAFSQTGVEAQAAGLDAVVIPGLGAASMLPVEVVVTKVNSGQSWAQPIGLVPTRAEIIWLLLGDEGGLQASWRVGAEVLTVESPASVWAPSDAAEAGMPDFTGSGTVVAVAVSKTVSSVSVGGPAHGWP
jgi:hypothetical protein